jgi:galactose oxidase
MGGQLTVRRSIAMAIAAGVSACASLIGAEAAAQAHGGHRPPGAGWTIGVEYVCDRQFVITNATDGFVNVTYAVAGTRETGAARLRPTPALHLAFSDTPIAVRNSGPVEVFVDGARVARAENHGVPCPTPTIGQRSLAAVAASEAEVGSWSAPFPLPVVAVHLSLLPNGRALYWGKEGVPQIWDPATGLSRSVPSEDWLFCAGHGFLPDGRLLIAGGHIAQNLGLRDINLFGKGKWTSSAPMLRGRWYPTVTTMATGAAVITAGTDETGINVAVPEVWTSGKVRALPGASLELPYYPRAFLAPNGKLFYAGEMGTTRYLDIAGSGGWTTVAERKFASRNYGAAVMYEPGKILYAGGGLTTNTAEVIDLTRKGPAWRFTGSMEHARRHHNLTLLPTGEVLATAGVFGTQFNNIKRAVHAAEIWNPETGTWRTVASGTVARGYHGTALLLPDGRVFQAGSGEAPSAPDERNAEIYAPPYLFAGPRPTIAAAPKTAGYGGTFEVATPDAAAITKVSLIRLGSVTHGFDMNQRYQRLDFVASATGLSVTAPVNRKLTPPGHYMLFILNAAGVPSVASVVQFR